MLLASLQLLTSLLHVARFSTVAHFPTESGDPAVDDIHDVSIVPAAAVIPND
jgi:hypothetical protein